MGRIVVRRRPVMRAKARVVRSVRAAANLRGQKVRVLYVRTRVAFTRMVVTTPFRPWVTEDVVRATRARSLLEDNPTSG